MQSFKYLFNTLKCGFMPSAKYAYLVWHTTGDSLLIRVIFIIL